MGALHNEQQHAGAGEMSRGNEVRNSGVDFRADSTALLSQSGEAHHQTRMERIARAHLGILAANYFRGGSTNDPNSTHSALILSLAKNTKNFPPPSPEKRAGPLINQLQYNNTATLTKVLPNETKIQLRRRMCPAASSSTVMYRFPT